MRSLLRRVWPWVVDRQRVTAALRWVNLWMDLCGGTGACLFLSCASIRDRDIRGMATLMLVWVVVVENVETLGTALRVSLRLLYSVCRLVAVLQTEGLLARMCVISSFLLWVCWQSGLRLLRDVAVELMISVLGWVFVISLGRIRSDVYMIMLVLVTIWVLWMATRLLVLGLVLMNMISFLCLAKVGCLLRCALVLIVLRRSRVFWRAWCLGC